MSRSSLYLGRVIHVRHKPVPHRLSYPALYLLLDLDEGPELSRRLRLFSLNRFNFFSFCERDHGTGERSGLRARLDGILRVSGIDPTGGTIGLLAMPRTLGFVFNPLSLYVCRNATGALTAILYEVNNTFGERHSYLIPVEGDGAAPLRQSCEKRFYVSPFMPMALTYRFRLTPPSLTSPDPTSVGERLSLVIKAEDAAGPVLTAMLSGERKPLTDRSLAGVFLRWPILAAQVLGAIHWEALRLWRKGLSLQPRPLPPAASVSIGRSEKGRA
jgi:DUF1365 family protein